jgi:molybdopterin-guanine dinucleotide biosynthesis protein B
MRMIRLVGRRGSGKTTLITALLPVLVARGLTVSTIKHAHHGFDLDRPGKDSFRHREAGAKEVMLISDSR